MSFFPLYLERFIRDTLPERDELLQQLERQAVTEKIPIVPPEVGQFLYVLSSIHDPKQVLEIGPAIGYSTIWLLRGAVNCSSYTAIERDPKRYHRLIENIHKAGFADRVTAILGSAEQIIPELEHALFDLVFIDAQKNLYPEFFALVRPLLAPGGLIVCDNVLFRGYVARNPGQVPQKYRYSTESLKQHFEMIMSDGAFEITLLPLGDGLLIGRKRY